MKFYLIVAKGKKQGMPIPVEVDLFLIGTGKMCQLRANHPEIGDQHCALVNRGKKVFVHDLDCGQPTLVNGTQVQAGSEWPVHPGDTLEVGPLKFQLQFREKALSQRDLEEWALKCLDQDAHMKLSAMDRLEGLEDGTVEKVGSAAEAASAILDRLQAIKGVVKGRLRIARENGITYVRVNDVHLVEGSELDFVKHELFENLNRPNLRVLIDLKHVRKMSSSAAQMFDDLRGYLERQGSRVAFCRLKSEFESMLKVYPAMKNIHFYAEKDKALTAKW